jgi:DMSO/TMAO reductase YedYZ molybdopterin-dependent catalytic subunit
MRRAPVRCANGFLTGVVAGVGATLVLFMCRLATGVPMPQEALAERMVLLLPSPVFALLLAELQELAKPLAFAAATGTMLIGFGLGGVVYRQVRSGRRSQPGLGLLAAVATWAFLAYIFLPFIEGGILGEPLTTPVPAPFLPVAVGSLAYGALLAVFIRADDAITPVPRSTDRRIGVPVFRRRSLLRRSTLIVLIAAAASRLGTWAGAVTPHATAAVSRVATAVSGAFRLLKGMPAEVTPNGEFYRVSKNFPFDPNVRVADWSLEVTGLVAKPLRLSYAEFVRAAPSIERYHTLECITNEVGGNLIGNAKWKGVRVRDILGLAEVQPAATTAVWRCADGYVEGIPIAAAMDEGTLLAYEMNGRPLPAEHGAPVRVLLLDRYGMKQPKWLTGIHLTDSNSLARWERRRVDNPATVKVNSAFRSETKGGSAMWLGGWAFAGSRGVAAVEVSADRGRTWFRAALKEPLGENCWQFWSAEWRPPAPGEYALWVRAVDGARTVQQGRRRRMPDGAEGYDEVRIRFAG